MNTEDCIKTHIKPESEGQRFNDAISTSGKKDKEAVIAVLDELITERIDILTQIKNAPNGADLFGFYPYRTMAEKLSANLYTEDKDILEPELVQRQIDHWVQANTEAKPKKPGLKTPPKGISSAALEAWPEFFKKYRAVIRASDKPEDPQYIWKTAMAIFRNYCGKHNIPLLDGTQKILKEDKQYMQNRLTSNRAKLVGKTQKTLKALKASGFLKRFTKETITDIQLVNNKWAITTGIKCVLNSPYSSVKFKSEVKRLGFIVGPRRLEFSIGSHVITVSRAEDPNACVINLSLVFTPEHVKYIVGANIVDPKIIKKNLSVLLKKELKTTNISTLVASLIPLDFNADPEFTEEELAVLKSLSSLDCETAKNTYDLTHIRSLGSPVFQLELVKELSKKCDNQLWNTVIRDPKTFLDPSVYRANAILNEVNIENDI